MSDDTKPAALDPARAIVSKSIEEYGTPEQLAQLWGAIAQAQGEFSDVPRNRKGRSGNQEYMYATLATVLKSVRPSLAKYGLAVVQPFAIGESSCSMTTVLSHSGGARLVSRSSFVLPGDLKDFGSHRTYMARYALNSLLCVDADADADELPEAHPMRGAREKERPQSNGKGKSEPRQEPRSNAPPMTPRETRQPERQAAAPDAGPPADGALMAALASLTRARGWSGTRIAESCRAVTGLHPQALEQPGGHAAGTRWLEALRVEDAEPTDVAAPEASA